MSHYSNRYSFWRDNKSSLMKIDSKFSSYQLFESGYFNNDTNFFIFFNLLRDRFNFSDELKAAYSIFACDLDWAKKTKYCSAGVTAPEDKNKPDNTKQNNTTLTGNDLSSGKNIAIGAKGDIVGKIQDHLIKLGYVNVSKNNTVDNIFGSRTKQMVMDFQSQNGLDSDGVVGKLTWAKLNDKSAVKNNKSSSGSAKADVPKDGETTAGSDAVVIKESLRKSLRKNLLKFN